MDGALFGLAVLEELSGTKTGIDDPFLPLHAGLGYRFADHQQK